MLLVLRRQLIANLSADGATLFPADRPHRVTSASQMNSLAHACTSLLRRASGILIMSTIQHCIQTKFQSTNFYVYLCHIFIAMKTIPAKAFQGASHASLELDVATRMLGAFHIIQAHVTTDTDLINDAYQTVFSEPRFLTACCHVLGAFVIAIVLVVWLTYLYTAPHVWLSNILNCPVFCDKSN
jgi:hypothetical protein